MNLLTDRTVAFRVDGLLPIMIAALAILHLGRAVVTAGKNMPMPDLCKGCRAEVYDDEEK